MTFVFNPTDLYLLVNNARANIALLWLIHIAQRQRIMPKTRGVYARGVIDDTVKNALLRRAVFGSVQIYNYPVGYC